jgi:hypothetical protein
MAVRRLAGITHGAHIMLSLELKSFSSLSTGVIGIDRFFPLQVERQPQERKRLEGAGCRERGSRRE